jgi:hypothetical protein
MDANLVDGRLRNDSAGRDQVEVLDVATILRNFSKETLVLFKEQPPS